MVQVCCMSWLSPHRLSGSTVWWYSRLIRVSSSTMTSGGSRIFPRGGREPSRGGMNTPNFPENCMKSKEFGRPGGGRASLTPPPRSANDDGIEVGRDKTREPRNRNGGNGHMLIGRRKIGGSVGPRYASVYVDEIKMYNRQLSEEEICLTSLTRAKCGTRSTLCWKNPNISGSIKLFAL